MGAGPGRNDSVLDFGSECVAGQYPCPYPESMH